MKALILAGGFGTRLSEETDIKPKPMVEVGGKPILWHIMKTYSHYGINEFVILLGYKGYYIKEYFANYFLHQSDVTIDIIYFGAYDLSQALGHPGNTKHPEVVHAIQQGVDLVNGADKYAGGFVPQSKDGIQELLDMGMKFITYEVDSSIIYKQVKGTSNWFSKLNQ